MPTHRFELPQGRLTHVTIESEALAGNLLGDPSTRTVAVYLPPGYDDTDEDYPLFVDLVGFTGSGLKHLSWSAFGESVPSRLDRLVATEQMGPVVAAFPDCFTSLGGNQYIDSVAMGNWATFLTQEMLPLLESSFRIRPGRQHRAVFGKSSGGYGAIVHGLRHAEHWGAVACHSGDMDFELVYRREFPALLDMLGKHGSIEDFLGHLSASRKINGKEMHALMALAMAATYDPDPTAFKGVRLPVDLHTCELDETAWARWLAHDPIHLVERPEHQAALRSLRGVYIDCGNRDQYALHYGSRRFVRRLEELAIEHRYEEFEDNHSSIDYRMDVSLPWLYERVS